jgi:hypothetical protein
MEFVDGGKNGVEEAMRDKVRGEHKDQGVGTGKSRCVET